MHQKCKRSKRVPIELRAVTTDEVQRLFDELGLDSQKGQAGRSAVCLVNC
jgi:hypothetical protein